jgi:GNAT superfamily N-acetyltransferase
LRVEALRLFRPHPRISLAKPEEVGAIAGLFTRAWDRHRASIDARLIADQSPGVEEVTAWLGGGFEVFTAHLDGELVGVIRCSFPTGTCQVDRMAVDPDRHRRGVGRALVEHAISRARRAGVTKVWVQTTPKLEAVQTLYRSLGFRESGHLRAHYWGEDVTLLELPL